MADPDKHMSVNKGALTIFNLRANYGELGGRFTTVPQIRGVWFL
jgi:hypothetical protein